MSMTCRCGDMFEASCAESSMGGELVVSCILLLGAVAVYHVQSCCAYSDETTSSDDEPAGMYT